MIETAMVFDALGKVIHWHEPPGRSGGSLPDSSDLWGVLWHNRYRLGGVAHTHPWDGEAWASMTDITTFKAVEDGLGIRLVWPVVTMTQVKYFTYFHKIGQHSEDAPPAFAAAEWWDRNIQELRRRSQGGQDG